MNTWSTTQIGECICPACGAICPVMYHEPFQMRVQGHCPRCGVSYYPTERDGEMRFEIVKVVPVMPTGERCRCGEKRSHNIVTGLMQCDGCGDWR